MKKLNIGSLGTESKLVVQGLHRGVCEIHGNYQSLIISGHIGACPKCVEKRILAEEREHAESVAVDVIMQRREKLLRDACVPERYRDKGFDNWDAKSEPQQKILDSVKKYAESFDDARSRGTSLIMSGMTGTGKSHLSVAVLEHVVRLGYSAFFISAEEALRMVQDSAKGSSKMTRSEAYAILCNPDLLVLDDVGAMSESDSTVGIINTIVYTRYNDYKPTIITTNDSLEELQQFIGSRIIDRLRESGGKLLPFKWSSVRGDV